jgi:hypothetical protein
VDPQGLVAADFDRDADIDLAVANGNSVGVLLNIPNAFASATYGMDMVATSGGIAAADVDDDGALDLVVTNSDNRLSVLFGNGDGTFAAPIHSPTPNGPLAVAVADIDGDRNPDIAVANGLANSISIFAGACTRNAQ